MKKMIGFVFFSHLGSIMHLVGVEDILPILWEYFFSETLLALFVA